MSRRDYVSQPCVVEAVFCLMGLPGNSCLQLGFISESSKTKIKKQKKRRFCKQAITALHVTARPGRYSCPEDEGQSAARFGAEPPQLCTTKPRSCCGALRAVLGPARCAAPAGVSLPVSPQSCFCSFLYLFCSAASLQLCFPRGGCSLLAAALPWWCSPPVSCSVPAAQTVSVIDSHPPWVSTHAAAAPERCSEGVRVPGSSSAKPADVLSPHRAAGCGESQPAAGSSSVLLAVANTFLGQLGWIGADFSTDLSVLEERQSWQRGRRMDGRLWAGAGAGDEAAERAQAPCILGAGWGCPWAGCSRMGISG